MKKKLLAVLLSLVAAFCCAFALSACSSPNGNSGSDDKANNTDDKTDDNDGNDSQNSTDGKDNNNDNEDNTYSSELIFELNDSGTEYFVTGLSNKTVTEIIIPNEYNGLPVTYIDVDAFRDCSKLSNISVPNSVTEIDQYAFHDTAWYKNQPNGLVYAGKVAYCYKGTMPDNTSITIADGTKGIADYAFENCNELTSITIPDSVTKIGWYALFGCYELTSIIIPDSVTEIGIATFEGCSGLTSITIPDSVIKIGGDAFNGTAWYDNQPDGLVYAGKVAYKYKGNMPKNTAITIADGTKSITTEAFRGCSSLTSVTIPDSVTNIGQWAFRGCSGLMSITVAENNTKYKSENNCLLSKDGKTLILGCKNSIIHDSVTSIGNYAFENCSGLTSIIIPDSVTEIGSNAFCNCGSLISISIPDSVTSIGNYAFEDTAWYNNQPDGLVYVGKVAYKYKGTMPENTSIILKEGTTGIANYAFAYFDSKSWTLSYNKLISIEIPNTVSVVGDCAFMSCYELTNIYYNGTKAQWIIIKKGNNWNYDTGYYKVHCINGDLSKEESWG